MRGLVVLGVAPLVAACFGSPRAARDGGGSAGVEDGGPGARPAEPGPPEPRPPVGRPDDAALEVAGPADVPADAPAGDGQPAGDAATREDASTPAPDLARPDADLTASPDGATATTDAHVVLPAPVLGGCVRVDDGYGAAASLFAAGGRWFAFFTEGTGATAPLRVRSASVAGLDFGPAATLLHGATRVDLVEDGGRLRALAARQFYAVFLESADGVVWTEGGKLATSEPDLLCTGFAPALFSRGEGSPRFVAAGRDYNTHLFGCSPQMQVALPAAGAWGTPGTVGKGHPVLAVHTADLFTVAGTFGVYVSRDQGTTFTEIKDGDTTAEQIRGTSGAASGTRLALAQSYGYGITDPNHIAVLFSDDGGATWPRRVVLERSSAYPGEPRVAGDGSFLAVAWQGGSHIRLVTSPDFGATWSARASVSLADDAGVAQLGGLAVSGNTVALATQGNGVRVCRL